MCVPGPDELVGIHVTTCVGDPGRMVTDLVYEWMALGVRMELRGGDRKKGNKGALDQKNFFDILVSAIFG